LKSVVSNCRADATVLQRKTACFEDVAGSRQRPLLASHLSVFPLILDDAFELSIRWDLPVDAVSALLQMAFGPGDLFNLSHVFPAWIRFF